MAIQTQPDIPTENDPGIPSSVNEEYLEELHPRPSFWQEPWVQNALPVVTSLLVHGALILIGLLTFQAYQAAVTVSQEQVIVPDAAIIEGDIGGVPNPGLDGDPNLAAASDLVPENTQSEGWNRQLSKSLQAAVMGGSGDTEANTVIGIGAAGAMGKGRGSGIGSGDGSGASAPFGVPGGGRGQGPKFMGLGSGGNVRSIVYLCDHSGSMMGLRFQLLKTELKKAVDALAPIQAFNIVFFGRDKVHPLSTSLMMAKPNNKQIAFKFIDDTLQGAGQTDPYKAMDLAFGNRPELMYVLSDGFENIDSLDELVDRFRKLNATKKTRVNTIAFFAEREETSDQKFCEDALRKIAAEHGGQFKVVLTSDLLK